MDYDVSKKNCPLKNINLNENDQAHFELSCD